MINIPDEVRYLIEKDNVRKNVRIHFPNEEYPDIINNQIVRDSLKFTESICTRSELQFGLCEASTLQIELVNVENITGCFIEVRVEIDCTELGEEWCNRNAETSEDLDFAFWPIQYGLFEVKEAKKQTDMTHRKITAYSFEIEATTSQLLVAEVNDKLAYEKKNKSTITFDAMFLAASCFPDRFMPTIFDYEELETNAYAATETSYTKDVKQSDGTIVHYTWHWESWAIVEEDSSGFKKEKFFGTKTKQTHELLYIPTTSIKTTISNARVFYNNMPKEIRDEISWYSFKKHISGISLLAYDTVTGDNHRQKEYFEKGNYCYIQECYVGSNINYRTIQIPRKFSWSKTDTRYTPQTESDSLELRGTAAKDAPKVYLCTNKLEQMKFTLKRTFSSDGSASVDITNAKEMLEGYLELNGFFGRFSRDGSFSLVTTEMISGLYPISSLYPGQEIYPSGTNAYLTTANYQTGWYDDELSKPYGRVYVNYMNDAGTTSAMYYDLYDDYEDNPERYLMYDLSSNYYCKNTMWSVSEISKKVIAVANKIKNIRYMPCNLKGIGLPFIEAGDCITAQTPSGEFRTIVLNRTIKGEQLLVDQIKSS